MFRRHNTTKALLAVAMLVLAGCVGRSGPSEPTTPRTPNTAASQVPVVAPRPRQRVPKEAGVAMGNVLWRASTTQLDLSAKQIAGLGMNSLSHDLNWADAQPKSRSAYNWAPGDAIVNAGKAHKLSVMFTLAYTPEWANGNCGSDKCLPTESNVSAMAAYARAAVEHYAPLGVHTWQVWNEPNIPDFANPVDPERYGAMLEQVSAAIREADPQARIIFGGLSPVNADAKGIDAVEFLKRALAVAGADSIDEVGYHPYKWWEKTADSYSQFPWSVIADLAKVSGKPVALTEIGVPTRNQPDAVNNKQQGAQIAADLRQAARDRVISSCYVYTLAPSDVDDAAGGFAVYQTNGQATDPAGISLITDAARQLTVATVEIGG